VQVLGVAHEVTALGRDGDRPFTMLHSGAYVMSHVAIFFLVMHMPSSLVNLGLFLLRFCGARVVIYSVQPIVFAGLKFGVCKLPALRVRLMVSRRAPPKCHLKGRADYLTKGAFTP